MSKAFFRFLRGELNGFYVQNINQAWNEYTSDIKDFFGKYKTMQFENGKIDEDYLYGLGKFAGIFLPRLAKEEASSVIHMTESHIVNENEYSERGLYNPNQELFEFFHLSEEETTDINTLATPSLRSSLVGDETPIGYISSEEADLFDDNGNVRPEKILVTPPSGVAYTEFYGNQFLFLSEASISYENLESSLYIELFKAMQYVRYNGTSLEALKKVIEAVCPNGFIKISRIEVASNYKHYILHYIYDDTVELDFKQQRFYLLEYVIKLKFQQLTLTEGV